MNPKYFDIHVRADTGQRMLVYCPPRGSVKVLSADFTEPVMRSIAVEVIDAYTSTGSLEAIHRDLAIPGGLEVRINVAVIKEPSAANKQLMQDMRELVRASQ